VVNIVRKLSGSSRFQSQVMTVVLTLVCSMLGGKALAESPVAIHVTQAELTTWRQRAIHGPYADDWQRILTRAKTFRSSPSSDLWPGNQESGPWDAKAVTQKQQGANFHPGRRRGDGLRDAGFAYLMTDDTSYTDAVRGALLKQAKEPGTDFANSSKWSPTTTILHDDNFEIANWLRKLAYGYSYIRSRLSEADRDIIDRWFLNAAMYWNQIVHNRAKSRFPNRLKDDYKTIGTQWPGSIQGKTHWEGYTVYSFHDPWKNIAATHNAMVAVVGVLLNNPILKNDAKRFVKEWLMFAAAPDGTVVDQFRWNNTTDKNPPQIGYNYAGTVIGSIVVAADHLARAGDTELYMYKTSSGYFGWEGSTKSLLSVLQRFAKITIGERRLGQGVLVYASKDSVLSSEKIIGPGDTYATDIGVIPANRYYNDPLLKESYTRRLPSRPLNGGYDPWGGDWGTYPGIRFMFGQMEGLVSPYTLNSPPNSQTSVPNTPVSLEVRP
jgi:hypothetical protein